jgi:hypothetical protein
MTLAEKESATAARSAKSWVFNPFAFIAGTPALAIGLAVILAAALLCWVTNTHFDGAIDIHPGLSAPLVMFVIEGLTDWLSLSVMLMIAGLIFRRSSFRIVDVFGTQAMARWPYIITPVMLLMVAPFRNAFANVSNEALKAANGGALPNIAGSDLVLIVMASVVILCCVIWGVMLMYRAYAVSCDTRGAKSVLSFIVAVIAAEIVSKVVLHSAFAHLASGAQVAKP